MTKTLWLSQLPRSDVLTLEDVLSAIDVALSEAEGARDPEWWRRPGLVEAARAVEDLERGVATNVDRGVEKFAPLAMMNLRRVLVDRVFALYDELDAAEEGLGAGDPLVWTPSAVKAELARVRGVLDTIDAEARQAAVDKKVSSDELKLWTEGAYAPGRAFVDNASTLWGSNVMTAREHEQNAAKWRAFFEQRGAVLKAPRDIVHQDKVNWEVPAFLVGVAVLLIAVKWKD
jgi:hypothetical protein